MEFHRVYNFQKNLSMYYKVYLIKYNLSLEKLKKTKWDFLKIATILNILQFIVVTNFIQLIFSQLVDWFSQTKLYYEVPNKGYLHIYDQ